MTKIKRLRGKKLLARVKELDNLNKIEKAKICGYMTQMDNGKERVQLVEFMNALLDTQGIQLDAQKTQVDDSSRRNRGRSLTYRASVQKNGNIIIGAGYTKKMGINPGEHFSLQLSRKTIKLTVVDIDSLDVDDEIT